MPFHPSSLLSSLYSFFSNREILFTQNFFAGTASLHEPIVAKAPFNNFTLKDYLLLLHKQYGDVINLKKVTLSHAEKKVSSIIYFFFFFFFFFFGVQFAISYSSRQK
jgi:hypothetical protein